MNLTEAQAEDLLDKLMDLVDRRVSYLQSDNCDGGWWSKSSEKLRGEVVDLLAGKPERN